MSTSEDAGGPDGYVFAVADQPYCCWEPNHIERSLGFLSEIDPRYFSDVAALLAEQLDSDHAMSASIALRATYQQGIEALMSLLGATAQAPASVHTWIARCSNQDLAEVVQRLIASRPLLTQTGRRPMNFAELSKLVHSHAWPEGNQEHQVVERFTDLWRRIAGEFLDVRARAEYNAIKHGNRVMPGGFGLAVGEEQEYGVMAPPDAMRPLGQSRFGSTFYEVEPVGDLKWHVKTRQVSVNWSASAMVHRLNLIAMSILNVRSALACDLGVRPAEVQFARPSDELFDDAWQPLGAPHHWASTHNMDPAPQDQRSRDELTKILEQRSKRW